MPITLRSLYKAKIKPPTPHSAAAENAAIRYPTPEPSPKPIVLTPVNNSIATDWPIFIAKVRAA